MTAKEMARAFKVSERTARRHIAKGSTPDQRRRRGQDGKTYPGSYRPPARLRGALFCDLIMARNAVRRIARVAEFHPADLADLRIIAQEAADLLAAWESFHNGGSKAPLLGHIAATASRLGQ